jgi:hypothetical protein
VLACRGKMQLLAGLVLGLMTAASSALFVLGLAALVGQRWKPALGSFVAGFVGVGSTMAAMSWIAKALMTGGLWVRDVPVEAKARALGENIAALMNVAALGLPAGVVVGALLVWRRHLRVRRA